ncbi:MAG TPA: type II toxin-antitoxin system RelE/ParE family toxin [Aliidongia sp.]|nr:type II toxin-antitoxin system RelE/ParE family toxin [Aliidongia sp.]
MRIALTSAAEADLAAALDWYDAEVPGVGPLFLDEFEVLLQRLDENPYQFPLVRADIRRSLFRRFPYGLFFRLQGDSAQIIACLHASRDPRRWQARH